MSMSSTPFVLGEMVPALHLRVSGMPCCGRRRRITRWEECRDYQVQGAFSRYLCLWTCSCGAEFSSDDWPGEGISTTNFMTEATG